jgi:hypothetical protein
MDLLYWILEYLKVNIVYMVLMFVWPSIIFKRFLKGRSFSFRVMFCPVISVLILNVSVLVLGQFHILSPALFRVLFYGSLLVSIYVKIPDKKEKLKEAGRVLAGSYGLKQMFLNLFRDSIDTWNSNKKAFKKRMEGHKLEYGLLAAVIVFGMIYFTYGTFLDHSYGAGDMYTHSSWIYGLVQGEIFSAGIYPEGMHCFIYAMHVLFGVKVFSCMLFVQCVNVSVILVSAYIFFKELFRSKYAPILALALFLTIDAVSIDEIYAMSRLQWTIPQEFGLFSAFICAAAFIRYLRSEGTRSRIRSLIHKRGGNTAKLNRLIYNDELVIFAGALAVSIATHFYVTGMAFFLCLCIVPFYILRVFNIRRLMPVVASIGVAVIVSVLPMITAYATGTKVQGSLEWGIDVIRGVEWKTQDTANNTAGDFIPDEESVTLRKMYESAGASIARAVSAVTEAPKTGNTSAFGKLKNDAVSVYRNGYIFLYGHGRAKFICIMTMIVFLLFVVLKIGNIIYFKRFNDTKNGITLFDGYGILAISTVLFMLLYTAGYIGLPTLFSPSRLCLIEQFLICAMVIIPLDLLFWYLENRLPEVITASCGIAAAVLIYIAMIVTGSYHGYLYCELTRYNQAVTLSESIISDMKDTSFTIVSPVEELYHVIEYGYHEELVFFINECVEKDYTIPTEYVFLFFEKHPIKLGQFNFYSGPGWLGKDKYSVYYDQSICSLYPAYITSTASPEIATGIFYKFPISSLAYSEWLTRTVLESRLLKWVNDFENLYPTELHVYYEDDDFVCYYFKQNPSCLYQLGFEKDDSRIMTEDVIYHTSYATMQDD